MMTYSQLREEIRIRLKCDACLERVLTDVMTEEIMTAIDTYLEEKAVEVEGMKLDLKDPEAFGSGQGRFNHGLSEAAAIIRSKE
jgi:hypothetical protein